MEWLESFLSDFKGACLIVSHDRYFLDRITDKTIELENQKIRCFSGNYSVFLQKKAAEQKAIAEKYDNDMKEIARLEGIIAQQRQWNREKNIKTAESKEKVIQRIRDQLVVPDAKLQKIRFDFTPSVSAVKMCSAATACLSPLTAKRCSVMCPLILSGRSGCSCWGITAAARPRCLKF